MRIVVVGALGGIGRHLVERLARDHEVVGVARTAPSRSLSTSPVRYVSSDDREPLAAAIHDADVVIHAALDARKRGTQFVRRNMALTRELLALSRFGPPKRFVYLSSWVVYSGSQPGPTGYREDQRLEVEGKLDHYTSLKLADERQVIDACRDADLDYLILRPTIVVGPGLRGPTATVRLARILPFGIRGRTLNVTHIDDLCGVVARLLELGVANEVVNVGGTQVSSEEFAAAVGRLANRRMRLRNRMPLPRRWMPSTLWFLEADVHVDCEKVSGLAGTPPARPIAELMAEDPFADTRADSLDAMRAMQKSAVPFWAYGMGYSAFLSPHRRVERERRVLLEPHRGIVSLNGNRVTVKSGTTLTEITQFLRQVGLTLATLPEFTGVTAGACFFVDLHGSSNDHFSMLDLIVEVKYLDPNGAVAVASRGDAQWHQLRRSGSGVFVTELTFECVEAVNLQTRLESRDDSALADYISHRHLENLSTVVQWYPAYRRLTVYNVNRAERPPERFAGPMGTYRNTPYPVHRLVNLILLRGRDTVYGHPADVLGSWKDIPHRKWWFRIPERDPVILDIEVLLTIEDGARLVQALQALPPRTNPVFRRGTSLGFRFGYRTAADGSRRGYVWIEWATKDAERLRRFTDFAESVAVEGVTYHQGKYVPHWVTDARVTAPSVPVAP